MVIKAVLFDLGETLFNYAKVNVDSLFKQGARLTYEYLCQISSGGDRLPGFKSYYLRHIISIRWHYFQSMLTNREFDCLGLLERKGLGMGIRLRSEQLEELAWRWYQPLGDKAQIEPDLAKHLQVLKDMSLKLAIVSNTFLPPSVLDRHLEKFNLLRFFPVRAYSSETIFRKPDRRIYLSVLDRLKIPADRAVMVGDKLREDIRGSARLGIKAILKRGDQNKGGKVPAGVPVVDSIGGLVELIRKL